MSGHVAQRVICEDPTGIIHIRIRVDHVWHSEPLCPWEADEMLTELRWFPEDADPGRLCRVCFPREQESDS